MTDKLRVHKWWPCGPIFLYVSPGPSLNEGAIAEIGYLELGFSVSRADMDVW